MAKKKIIILGAGLTGLSAAWHLQEKGVDCEVFEKEPEVGGLCRSKNIGGYTFDYDGHLLHFKQEYSFNLIKRLLGNNLSEHRRSAWIYSNGSYSRYPFQANLYGLSPATIKECLLGLIEAGKKNAVKKKDNMSFLDWIYMTFGNGIAKHFMIPYNTKFWTLPPEELTCAWLDGFIPVPSMTQAVEGALGSSKEEFGYNAHFWYPRKSGIAQLPEALAERIRNVHIDCEITRINLDEKEITIKRGLKKKYDYLISTIPLPELPYIIKHLPKNMHSAFGSLKWNSIFNLNLGLERKKELNRHWVYFPQQDLSFFRVGFFHNFSSSIAPAGTSSIYVEVSYSREKPLDKAGIVPRIKDDLKKVGIISQNERICVQDTNNIKYGYPIYDKHYALARERILKFLLKHDIASCGRYGSWRYMSMEGALLDGKSAAESLK